MATIVNNPPPERPERVVVQSDSGGWGVAVVVLILGIVIGAFGWMYYHRAPAPEQNGSGNINVTLPGGSTTTGY